MVTQKVDFLCRLKLGFFKVYQLNSLDEFFCLEVPLRTSRPGIGELEFSATEE